MTNTPPSEQERKFLQEQRAITRRRKRSAKIAAKALAVWIDPHLGLSDTKLSEAGDRWLARLGEENTRRLAMRMRRMADWEMLRAEQMRDTGASAWMLLKYLGASQDMVIDGPACRDTVYTEVMQQHGVRSKEKTRETVIKAAIPLAVVATVATLATAGVGYVVAAAGPALGMDPSFAADAWQNWQTVFSPVLSKAKDLVYDFDIASGGIMFALGAFWMWAHDSRVAEDLRLRAAQKEVPSLEAGIGFHAKAHRIQSAIRSIPEHDRILLAHFSSTDLRAFLLSADDERMHMLRENRPPLMAQFKAVLAKRDRTWLGLLPAIRDIADVCMPKRWARAIGAYHPGEISPERMKVWRAPKDSLGLNVAPSPTTPTPNIADTSEIGPSVAVSPSIRLAGLR